MKLPDFATEAGFEQLRQDMGASKDGRFQLFDPERHVSFQELEQLSGDGLIVSAHRLRTLADETLAFKDRRVWLQPANADADFHLSDCAMVQSWRHTNTDVLIGWSNGIQETAPVCLACLAEIHFEGMDARRLRRQEYAQQVQTEFRLGRYWALYSRTTD